jgi:hypothetical protein
LIQAKRGWAMQQSSALNSVLAWQAAVNAQDLDGLLEHSAPDIAVVGPRGTGVGHQVLREWLARAGLTLTTTRAFVRGDTVVLAQRGVWHALDTGAVTGDRTLATVFQLNDQRQVARFARFDDLAEALAAAGLGPADESDQVTTPGE